jgi:plastocyanin
MPVRSRQPFRRFVLPAIAPLAATVIAGALALGASEPRGGVTLCATTVADMRAALDAHFATRPAHGATPAAAAAITANVAVTNFRFDVDGSSITQVDTVKINVGESVQFNLVTGIHTVTSGSPGDLNAGSLFDLPVDISSPTQVVTFPNAGTFNYFCSVHTFANMVGVVVVKAPTGAPPPARPSSGFLASPWPNPSRGGVALRFASARDGRVRVVAFDAGGRQVATLFDRDVAAGAYSAEWSATGGAGRTPPGTYFLRLTTPDRVQTLPVTILR